MNFNRWIKNNLTPRLSKKDLSRKEVRRHSYVTDESGIALFMVLTAVSVLALLVVEFTYIAQVNQSIAYGALDQAQAHYLAKSGLKLSLLRLKAYQQVKSKIKQIPGGASVVPKSLIEKIWNFPFMYPFPTSIPGMSRGDKETIEKFQSESGLKGEFTAVIESESSKYNLNLITGEMSLAEDSSQTLPRPSPSPSPNPSPSASATPFNKEAARESLSTFLGTLLNQRFEKDPDFASFYRDLRLEDLVDNIVAWADPSYERRTSSNRDRIPMKQGPFFSVSELHYLSTIDDEIYQIISPSLTASKTSGINVNTIQKETLAAFVPAMSDDEVTEFFKFRDNMEQDNSFQTPEKFFEYIKTNVAAYQNTQTFEKWKADLTQRNIQIITEEQSFKITVQAKVNNAVRTIEAWVTLGKPDPTARSGQNRGQIVVSSTNPLDNRTGAPPRNNNVTTPGSGSETGLTITYMRIQ